MSGDVDPAAVAAPDTEAGEPEPAAGEGEPRGAEAVANEPEGDLSAAGGGGADVTAGAPCPACGEPLTQGARFCEACGAAAGDPGDVAFGAGAGDGPRAAAVTQSGPMVEPAGECAKCGGTVDTDGYCTSCGHRALEEVTVDDRGPIAYATHRGRRHPRNEDSAALAVTSEGWAVVVVSDGVSVSPNPHRASAAAVAAAAGRLAGRSFGGEDDLLAAVADAHEAAVAVPNDDDPLWKADGSHPACTIVVAVATGDAVHVANVGDARAHLLHGVDDRWAATQLTTDDSVAAQAVEQGIDPEVALNLPGGHGITAWLGADAPPPAPHVSTVTAAPGDILLVSSDGLWNYAPTDAAMGELLTSVLPPPGAPAEPPADDCARLVDWANEQGGADNITVAITPVHPELEDNA